MMKFALLGNKSSFSNMFAIASSEDITKLHKTERFLKRNGQLQRCRIALAPQAIQNFHREAKVFVDRTPGAAGAMEIIAIDMDGGNNRQQFCLTFSAKRNQTYTEINPAFAGGWAGKFRMRIFK